MHLRCVRSRRQDPRRPGTSKLGLRDQAQAVVFAYETGLAKARATAWPPDPRRRPPVTPTGVHVELRPPSVGGWCAWCCRWGYRGDGPAPGVRWVRGLIAVYGDQFANPSHARVVESPNG